MNSESTRSFKLIRQEIDELNDVIRLTKEFEKEYPEDNAISLSLKSLEYKQELLFKELEKSNLKTMRESFDFCLDAMCIRDNMISLSFVGGILTTFQDVVIAIVNKQMKKDGTKRISESVKKAAQLNLLTTTPGSFRIVVTPERTSISNEIDTPTISALNQFNHILDCGYDIDKIKEIRSLLGARVINKYKDFMYVLVQNKSSISFYKQLGNDRFSPIHITKEAARGIYDTLSRVEDITEQTELLMGKLRGIDMVTKKFRFELDDGNYITGKYDESIEEKVANPHFKEEIVATFTHAISFNEALDSEKDEWTLVDINKTE